MLKLCISFSALLILPFVASCPPAEQLYPCVCVSTRTSSEVSCSGLENEQILSDVVHALRPMKKFYSFAIRNGVFRFIPQDIFDGVKFQEFQIISSSFMALTDTDVAFGGLEQDLVSLVITNSTSMNAWDWSVFRNLKNLIKLHIAVDLNIVSEDIQDLSSLNLRDISLARNHIEHIDDTAFAGFVGALSIALERNAITQVKRSMFPNPAILLWKLDLGHNKIEQLPENLFENMPSLMTLNVESNRLLTLSENTFKTVWSQLEYFDAMDNPIRCDCRLSWITTLKFPPHINAVCGKPKNLALKHLENLTAKELWCVR